MDASQRQRRAAAAAEDVEVEQDDAATATAFARDLAGSARRKKILNNQLTDDGVCRQDAVDKGGG